MPNLAPATIRFLDSIEVRVLRQDGALIEMGDDQYGPYGWAPVEEIDGAAASTEADTPNWLGLEDRGAVKTRFRAFHSRVTFAEHDPHAALRAAAEVAMGAYRTAVDDTEDADREASHYRMLAHEAWDLVRELEAPAQAAEAALDAAIDAARLR
jgi:hypothetical protein